MLGPSGETVVLASNMFWNHVRQSPSFYEVLVERAYVIVVLVTKAEAESHDSENIVRARLEKRLLALSVRLDTEWEGIRGIYSPIKLQYRSIARVAGIIARLA